MKLRHHIIVISLLIITCFISLNVSSQAAEDNLDPDQPLVKSIFFGGGSFYVDPEQSESLQDFLNGIPNIDMYTITIHSHTDNIGGAEYNNWLSNMRSESVAYELIMQQIPSNNIRINDFGQTKPIFDNRTYKSRLLTPRVEIILYIIVFE